MSHSSFCSISRAPAKRSRAASLGKIPRLLCLSSRVEDLDGWLVVAFQEPGELAGDDALEAPADLAWVLAVGGPPLHIGAGQGVVAHADDGDGVQGMVELPVAAAIQPVAPGLSGAGGDRAANRQDGGVIDLLGKVLRTPCRSATRPCRSSPAGQASRLGAQTQPSFPHVRPQDNPATNRHPQHRPPTVRPTPVRGHSGRGAAGLLVA